MDFFTLIIKHKSLESTFFFHANLMESLDEFFLLSQFIPFSIFIISWFFHVWIFFYSRNARKFLPLFILTFPGDVEAFLAVFEHWKWSNRIKKNRRWNFLNFIRVWNGSFYAFTLLSIEFCNCYHIWVFFLLSIWIWMIELDFFVA